MSTSERLRQLRKDLGMSQEEFGRRIGVSNTAISKLEKNERNLTEQTAKSICREFRVNYFWLTEGKGDMFTGTPESVVDEIAEDYNLDDTAQAVHPFLLLSYVSALLPYGLLWWLQLS